MDNNKTKKCRGIDPELCKTREDCFLDNLGICKKKPKKTKKNKASPQLSEKITINNVTTIVEDIPNAIYDPCEEKQNIEKNIKELAKEKMRLNEDCNQKKYETIKNLNLVKLMDLIVYIFENKIEKYSDLLNLFPESNEKTKGYLSKPYIFEALWKIIFLLNLDNLTDGFKRKYKISIENNQDIEVYDYLNGENSIISNINSVSESGIADFYFTVVNDEKEDNKSESRQNACEDPILKPMVNDAYLFTSKFYRKEKSITKYDIQDIVLEVQEKYEKNKYKIVSLVRDGAEYKNRLQRTSKEVVKQYVDTNLIFDEGDLNIIYYPKLYKLITYWFDEQQKNINNENDWREILKNPKEIINILDNLRFHQKYVVEYTNNIIETKEEGRFIWGAVARSGKSYMVGGLVAKRNPKIVLLILGAINETKSQFIDDLFKKYTDLKDYQIIDFQDTKEFKMDDTKKYVFVISQESLRLKILNDFCRENPEDKVCKKKLKEGDDGNIKEYNSSIIDIIKYILKEQDKIIFFDEIHQGSGTDSMQEETIKFFYDNSPKEYKVILIMVTATYAKPLAKYDKNIDGKDCILIEWNYDMIMKMKIFQIENVTIEEDHNNKDMYLIDINDADFKNKMATLKKITTELNDKGKTCQDIAYEYINNPELAYLLPTINPIYSGKNKDIDEDYNIVEEDEDEQKINVRNNLKQIFTLNRGENRNFKYKNSVNKLLNYIYDDVYNELLEKQYNFVANGEGTYHSQLWFLPTSMQNETQKKEEGEDKSIVGPMLRNLGEAIINHPKFINFNVCVVHSGKETETEIISKADYNIIEETKRRKVFFQCIKSSGKYKGIIKNCIKDIENKSKKEDKSLIILTAQRLRLGISLPCVDVAIHMDDIKSYDIVYQSMFRVLTERAGKTHGYFVDMVLDRAIQFFYKYTRNQKKNRDIIALTKEDIKKSLLLFDVGSIKKSIGFTQIETPINSYSEIAESFKIDKDEKFEKFKEEIFKNKQDKDNDDDAEENDETVTVHEEPIDITKETEKNKKQIVQLLQNLYKDRDIREELNQLIKNIKYENKTVKKGSKKPKQILSPYKGEVDLQNGQNNVLDDEVDEVNDDEPEDKTQIFKNITEQITNIFTLLILFNDDRVELRNVLNTDNLDINKITNCEDDDIMYYCYLISTIDNSNKIGDIVKNNEDGKIGEIIDIKTTTGQEEGQEEVKNKKKETIFEIQFDNEVVRYELNAFKSTLTNMSIPNNFNLKDMSNEFIKTYIQKHVDLMLFLIDKQTNMELINLFNNIKEDMKELKEKIHKEKSLFEGVPLDKCPEDFIQNEKVLDLIRKYLTPKDTEKSLFGEVFTPLELVCEMLSKLPLNVWKNKDLKWLDPANGIGNFPVVVYYKLMESLKEVIPNDKKRSVWIIEEMLYMNELNPVNVSLSKKIFKMIEPDATPNIIKADFITDNAKVLNMLRDKMNDQTKMFDVIIGNPPYNSNGVGKGGGVLWKEFVFTSFNILNDKGFLVFVHPTGWRKPSGDRPSAGDIWLEFKKHNLIFLKISDKKIPRFPTVDYYVIQKNAPQKETHIINEFENSTFEGKLDLYNLDFIPSFINKDVITILHKIFSKKGDKFNIIYNQSFKPTKEDMKKTGIPHAYYYDPSIEDYLIANKKYNEGTLPDYIDKNKIIMTYSNGKKKGLLYPKYYSEHIGTTRNTMYQLVEKEDNQRNFITLLDSDLINFILKITQYSEPPNYKNEFKILNMISKPNDANFKDDNDIFDYYNLNSQEIQLIKNINEMVNKTLQKPKAIIDTKIPKSTIKKRREVSRNRVTIKKSSEISLDKPRKKTIKKTSKTKGGKTRKHKSVFKFW
jgi:hypothetical protein